MLKIPSKKKKSSASMATGESAKKAAKPTTKKQIKAAIEEHIVAYRDPEVVNKTGEKMDHIHSLDVLQEFIGECTRCKLCEKRKHVVFGEGNAKAKLMFVGEGPGAEEDEQNRPFVGRSGKLLTKMIEAMGLTREQVYIANVVKCRPPNNRNPEPDEVETCIPFLMKQIEIIKPKVIVCLGKYAAQEVLKTQIPISKMRGRFQEVNGVQVMPTFHPAYLLRNPPMKKFAWEDLQQVMKKLGLKEKTSSEK